MQQLLGTQLRPEARQEALSAFVHRFTGQHIPSWATERWKGSQTYPVQFKDDEDWLAHTRFSVTASGRLDRRADHCESSPTWPLNPELRRENLAAPAV